MSAAISISCRDSVIEGVSFWSLVVDSVGGALWSSSSLRSRLVTEGGSGAEFIGEFEERIVLSEDPLIIGMIVSVIVDVVEVGSACSLWVIDVCCSTDDASSSILIGFTSLVWESEFGPVVGLVVTREMVSVGEVLSVAVSVVVDVFDREVV